MSRELKKLALFGIIIAVLTSAYVTFLGTGLKQGFFDGWFLDQLAKTNSKSIHHHITVHFNYGAHSKKIS